eukprot:scaffold293702_cov28-Tisochrysis_lutea.AAC.1
MFAGDRTSSRVLAAPGGHSTLNIFSSSGTEQPASGNYSVPPPPAVKNQDSFGQRVVNRSEHGDFGLQRNSSRVLAAPGGASTLNLFGGDAPGATRAPATQPAQNSVRTDGVFGHRVVNRSEHGDFGLQRNSSRVLAAPGGKSSFSFSDPQAPLGASARQPSQQVPQDVVESSIVPFNSQMSAGQRVGNQEISLHARPSTRVHAAPGGNSSICLGSDVPSSVDARKAALMARRVQAPFTEVTNYTSDRPF